MHIVSYYRMFMCNKGVLLSIVILYSVDLASTHYIYIVYVASHMNFVSVLYEQEAK